MAGERDFLSFSVDTNTLDGDQNIDALLKGRKWDTTLSNVITFSFIDSASDLSYAPSGGATFANQFSATQQEAAGLALLEFELVCDVVFTELTGADDVNATLRFADYDGLSTAFGYYPAATESAGDMAFKDGKFETADLGSYEFHTMLHEIGHAMGLRHGHETDGPGAMTPDRDGMEYSVMTYNSFIGHNGSPPHYTNSSGHYAQTLMMYDIAALQRMYGPNWAKDSGHSVYTFSTTTGETFINGDSQGVPDAPVVFRTEWDAGGNDTYDLSNFSTDLRLDLTPGGYSDFDVGGTLLRARLNSGYDEDGTFVGASEHEYAAGHLYNALQYNGSRASLIENAIGGSGNDHLLGNGRGNLLQGNAGNDTLDGMGGFDNLIGGTGVDWLFGRQGNDTLSGGRANDRLRGGNGNDTIEGGGGADNIHGGNGADVFVYNTAYQTGHDKVRGFENGTDLIRMIGITIEDVMIGQSGDNTLIQWTSGAITLFGELGLIDGDDFDFI